MSARAQQLNNYRHSFADSLRRHTTRVHPEEISAPNIMSSGRLSSTSSIQSNTTSQLRDFMDVIGNAS